MLRGRRDGFLSQAELLSANEADWLGIEQRYSSFTNDFELVAVDDDCRGFIDADATKGWELCQCFSERGLVVPLSVMRRDGGVWEELESGHRRRASRRHEGTKDHCAR